MADLDEELKDGVEGSDNEESEVEDKPELPKEPVDKNEAIEVHVQRPSRQEKKANRFKEFEERTARAEKAAEEARREAQEARALHQQRLAHPQDQSTQQVHPAAQRLRQIDEETKRLHREYEAVASRPGFTPQMQEEYEQRSMQLQTARIATIAQAAQQPLNEDDLYRKVAWRNFTSEHYDVFSDQKIANWAMGRWTQLVQGEGKADTRELAEEILDEARIKFGKQPRRGRGSRPDAATQRRLSGVSAQGGGGGDAEVGTVKMGAMERKMARELYDNLPPEQAYQKWANGPGKRAAAKMALRK